MWICYHCLSHKWPRWLNKKWIHPWKRCAAGGNRVLFCSSLLLNIVKGTLLTYNAFQRQHVVADTVTDYQKLTGSFPSTSHPDLYLLASNKILLLWWLRGIRNRGQLVLARGVTVSFTWTRYKSLFLQNGLDSTRFHF